MAVSIIGMSLFAEFPGQHSDLMTSPRPLNTDRLLRRRAFHWRGDQCGLSQRQQTELRNLTGTSRIRLNLSTTGFDQCGDKSGEGFLPLPTGFFRVVIELPREAFASLEWLTTVPKEFSNPGRDTSLPQIPESSLQFR